MAALSFPTTRASGLARELRLQAPPMSRLRNAPLIHPLEARLHAARPRPQPPPARPDRASVGASHLRGDGERVRRGCPAHRGGYRGTRLLLETAGFIQLGNLWRIAAGRDRRAPGSMQQYSQALPDGVNSVTGTALRRGDHRGRGRRAAVPRLRHSAPASRSARPTVCGA